MAELYVVGYPKVNRKSFLIALVFISQLSSCASWLPDAAKIDIPQGNKLEQKQINQITIGLTKEQVRYLLGASILTPNIKADDWQYMYFNSKAGDEPKNIKLLEVFFKAGKVTGFKSSIK